MSAEVEKIVVHRTDGTKKVIRQTGLVAYAYGNEEQHLNVEFAKTDTNDITQILTALNFALQQARKAGNN